MKRAPYYSDAEVAILQKYYPSGGPQACIPLLPGRNEPGIVQAAKRRGIHCHPPQWSEEQIATLRNQWHVTDISVLAKKIGRSRTSIVLMVKKLGLKRGIPEGCESITAAARRTGFDVPTLRNVLSFAGVHVSKSQTMDKKKRHSRFVSFRQHHVDSFSVDEAIEKWNQSELVSGAADRRGISDHVLFNRLARDGIIDKPNIGRRCYRVPTVLIDQTIAKYGLKPKETVQAAE